MRKLFILLMLFVSFSYAGLVNAVAVKVNDSIITLYDIDKRVEQKSISKKVALEQLVDEKLFEQELKQQNVTVDIFDINDYLEKVAASNGMDLYTFKSVLKQKYPNEEKFENQIKDKILRERLTAKLVRGKLKIASKDDILRYYENNKTTFKSSKSFKIIQYVSKNKSSLLTIAKSPMTIRNDVHKDTKELENEKISPELKFILSETKEGSFTPIFTSNKQFVMLYLTKKIGTYELKLEEVKEKIFANIMKDREKNFLKEHFKKTKLTANIEVVR